MSSSEIQSVLDILAQARKRFVTAHGRTDKTRLWVVQWDETLCPDEASLKNMLGVSNICNALPSIPNKCPVRLDHSAYLVNMAFTDDKTAHAFVIGPGSTAWPEIQSACEQTCLSLSSTLGDHFSSGSGVLSRLYKSWSESALEWGAAFKGSGQPLFNEVSWATFLWVAPTLWGYGIGAGINEDCRKGLTTLSFRDPIGLTSITAIENLSRVLTTGVEQAVAKRKGGEGEKRSWTQSDLDEAIRGYKAKRSVIYSQHVEAIKKGLPGAKKDVGKTFGRNVIVKALGVRSPNMVSKSPVWTAIAKELGIPLKRDKARGTLRTPKVGKIGLDIALEEASMASAEDADPDAQLLIAERKETLRMIGSLPPEQAELIVAKYDAGEMTDEQAREMVRTLLDKMD